MNRLERLVAAVWFGGALFLVGIAAPAAFSTSPNASAAANVVGAMLTPSLNALRLGADAAAGLGLRVERARFAVLTAAALITAACVAVSGIVGFVGLMVPHAARRLVGGDARWLMPASAVGGALVVVVADAIARTAVPATEVPLGVLLALVGVPFFLIIARRPVAL